MKKETNKNHTIYSILLSIAVSILFSECAGVKQSNSTGKLTIQEQGSFTVGGTPNHLSAFIKRKGLV